MPEVEVVWPLAPPVDRARRCEAGLPRPHQHLAIECVQKPKMLEFGEDDQRPSVPIMVRHFFPTKLD